MMDESMKGPAESASERKGLQNQRHAALILGLLAGCLAYVAAHHFSPPMLSYLPEVGEWSFLPPPGLIAMRYYGMLLYGLGGFLLGWMVGKLPVLGTRFRTRRRAAALTGSTAAALTGGLIYCLVVELTRWAGR